MKKVQNSEESNSNRENDQAKFMQSFYKKIGSRTQSKVPHEQKTRDNEELTSEEEQTDIMSDALNKLNDMPSYNTGHHSDESIRDGSVFERIIRESNPSVVEDNTPNKIKTSADLLEGLFNTMLPVNSEKTNSDAINSVKTEIDNGTPLLTAVSNEAPGIIIYASGIGDINPIMKAVLDNKSASSKVSLCPINLAGHDLLKTHGAYVTNAIRSDSELKSLVHIPHYSEIQQTIQDVNRSHKLDAVEDIDSIILSRFFSNEIFDSLDLANDNMALSAFLESTGVLLMITDKTMGNVKNILYDKLSERYGRQVASRQVYAAQSTIISFYGMRNLFSQSWLYFHALARVFSKHGPATSHTVSALLNPAIPPKFLDALHSVSLDEPSPEVSFVTKKVCEVVRDAKKSFLEDTTKVASQILQSNIGRAKDAINILASFEQFAPGQIPTAMQDTITTIDAKIDELKKEKETIINDASKVAQRHQKQIESVISPKENEVQPVVLTQDSLDKIDALTRDLAKDMENLHSEDALIDAEEKLKSLIALSNPIHDAVKLFSQASSEGNSVKMATKCAIDSVSVPSLDESSPSFVKTLEMLESASQEKHNETLSRVEEIESILDDLPIESVEYVLLKNCSRIELDPMVRESLNLLQELPANLCEMVISSTLKELKTSSFLPAEDEHSPKRNLKKNLGTAGDFLSMPYYAKALASAILIMSGIYSDLDNDILSKYSSEDIKKTSYYQNLTPNIASCLKAILTNSKMDSDISDDLSADNTQEADSSQDTEQEESLKSQQNTEIDDFSKIFDIDSECKNIETDNNDIYKLLDALNDNSLPSIDNDVPKKVSSPSRHVSFSDKVEVREFDLTESPIASNAAERSYSDINDLHSINMSNLDNSRGVPDSKISFNVANDTPSNTAINTKSKEASQGIGQI